MSTADYWSTWILFAFACAFAIVTVLLFYLKKQNASQVAFACMLALGSGAAAEALIARGIGMTTPPLDMFYPLIQYGYVAFGGALFTFAVATCVGVHKWMTLGCSVAYFMVGFNLFFAELQSASNFWIFHNICGWLLGFIIVGVMVVASDILEVIPGGSATNEKCDKMEMRFSWWFRAAVIFCGVVVTALYLGTQIGGPLGTDTVTLNRERDINTGNTLGGSLLVAIVTTAIASYFDASEEEKAMLRNAVSHPGDAVDNLKKKAKKAMASEGSMRRSKV